MRKRSFAAAGLALAVLGGSLWVWRTRAAPIQHQAAPVAQASPEVNAPGTQRRWKMELVAELAQTGEAKPVQVRLTGEWITTVAAKRGHEIDFACEIAGAQVSGGGPTAPPPEQVEALRRRFSRRFWVTYRDDGAAVGIHFPKEIDPADRNLLLLVPTETQLVRPSGAAGSGAAWTALERDGAGIYLAAYQREDANHIAKRKLRYTEIDGAGGSQQTGGAHGFSVEIGRSEKRFTLDVTGRIASFEGADRIRIALPPGNGSGLEVGTTIHLSDPRDANAPELAGSLLQAAGTIDDSPIRTQKVDPALLRRQRDERLLSGQTASALLAAAASPKPDKLLPAQLAALFRLHPETLATAVESARKGSATQLFFGAIAASGSAAALAMVGAAAQDRALPVATRIDAVAALLVVDSPPPETMRLVLDLCDDGDASLRPPACLMSGSLAHAGRANHPVDADAVDSALAERFAKATDSARRINLLEAMGNSAGPKLLPVLIATLHNAPPTERAAAVRSLRLVDRPDSDALLNAAITSDRDPGVREAAIFTARFRPFDPFAPALMKAVTVDPVESVRANALEILGRHLAGSPKIRAALSQVAEHDPKPDMRRRARAALAGRQEAK